MSKYTVVVDADFIRYAASGVGETRSINVIHKPSGREKEFSNRTEFHGRGKKKDGGWLGEINKSRTSPFLLDEFEIVDVQTPEPIENVLHTAKSMFEGCLKALDTAKYIGFLGKGDSFRVEKSTLLKYKGQRAALLKPLYLDDVTQYLYNKFKLEFVEGIESDDACIIEAHKKSDHVVVAVDKDMLGCPVLLFNPNHPELGVQNCNQFGKLWRDDKGKVRGVGRMFLYFQMCSSDSSDNYKASCFSDLKWADVSAYNALKDATNDKEALQIVVDVFKKLYPEPKVVTGWRGNDIEIDWLYVASEMFTMARMLKFKDEKLELVDVFDKLGVEYGS